MMQAYGVSAYDKNDKTTWKYYKNICGQYHFTDQVMVITSLDSLQNITFSRENLITNTATKKAYQYGSRNYEELVSIYPDQEMLILGILYPADMTLAISAKDGTILSYPKNLVEGNEVNLISKLNEWIQTFKIRWYNRQFGVSDSLYGTTHLGLLYLSIVPAIFNIRLGNCKTNMVHSYHIRQYLASHGMLDEYLEVLTKKQALFFYRNITYIERNSGKRFIFEWLIEHIMTERGLPVAEIVMKHNVAAMPGKLRPFVELKTKSINPSISSSSKSSYNLVELLTKQQPLFKGNKEYIEQNKEYIERQLQNSLSSVVATKVLESSMIDYTDATPYTLYDVCLNNWIDQASNGDYTTFIIFKNAKTGESHTLKNNDAFIYFAYTITKALGGNPTVIPEFIASRILKNPIPTVSSLLANVDNKYIKSQDALQVLSYIPTKVKSVSVDSFYQVCLDLFKMNQNHLRFVSSKQHLYTRGLAQNLVNSIYCTKSIALAAPGKLFSEWLTQNNLPNYEFTSEQYLQMNKDIFESATGSFIDSTLGTKTLQTAMINLMKKLSSYSVQFINEVNGSNLRVLNTTAIRAGDIKSTGKGHVLVPKTTIDVVKTKGKSKAKEFIELNLPEISLFTPTVLTQRQKYKLPIEIKLFNNVFTNVIQKVNLGPMRLIPSYNVLSLNNLNYFIGYEDFFLNHTSQGNKLRDNYNFTIGTGNSIKLNIDQIIPNNQLEMLKYTGITNQTLDTFEFESIGGSTLGLTFNPAADLTISGFTNNSQENTPLNAFVLPNELG